jgi:hypothetical protein
LLGGILHILTTFPCKTIADESIVHPCMPGPDESEKKASLPQGVYNITTYQSFFGVALIEHCRTLTRWRRHHHYRSFFKLWEIGSLFTMSGPPKHIEGC